MYRTDMVCTNYSGRSAQLQYDCLEIRADLPHSDPRQIILYCLTDCSFKSFPYPIDHHPYYTFHQLAQLNITTQELHLWSASIDLIERYQHFLNQPVSSSHTNHSINHDLFYNCTWPRFGPFCQYSFAHLAEDDSLTSTSFASVDDLVRDFYMNYPYEPATLTCYENLKCTRNPGLFCLDWSEVCDGVVDCVDDGSDEEHCWQLEIHECADDEFQCQNGQCIPKIFARDEMSLADCFDGSDESIFIFEILQFCHETAPIFGCEDVRCEVFSELHPSPMTSSCVPQRGDLMKKILFLAPPTDIVDSCRSALQCMLYLADWIDIEYQPWFTVSICKQKIRTHCPDLFFLPTVPILFGHVYFGYTQDYIRENDFSNPPEWICLRDQFCNLANINETKIPMKNITCVRPEQLQLNFKDSSGKMWMEEYVRPVYERLRSCRSDWQTDPTHCREHHLFQCRNTSQCVAKRHLLDGITHCPFGDDEQMATVQNFVNLTNDSYFFYCQASDTFISYSLVGDSYCHCPGLRDQHCDDEFNELDYIQNHIMFQTICDGFTDLVPVSIDGEKMSDETNCDYWPCNNVYTRCDWIWNCYTGDDEMNCTAVSNEFHCPLDHRECVSPETNELTCLSVVKVNDGHVDCLGGTDEVAICRLVKGYLKTDRFYCRNDSKLPCMGQPRFCNGVTDCLFGDDEQFCEKQAQQSSDINFCYQTHITPLTAAEKHFCQRFMDAQKDPIKYFTLATRSRDINQHVTRENNLLLPSLSRHKRSIHGSICHRGLPLHFWHHHNHTLSPTILCLCPPSFYGSHCQFQNQRITLTLQFLAPPDSWQTFFAIVVLLVHHDEHTQQSQIHSSQQFTYLPMRDCQMRFNFYLLYASRPIDLSLNYSILIHIYDKTSLTYRASYLIPVLFPFLPVYRVALQIHIPPTRLEAQSSDDDLICPKISCGLHGRCILYTHHRHVTPSSQPYRPWFCQCDQGWSGQFCTIPSACSCSSDSLCLGNLINGRSVCLCPSHKLGDRCLIEDYICHDHINGTNTCLNGGQCIPQYDAYLRKQETRPLFTCICPKGFAGDRCEMMQTQIILSFDASSSFIIPESMLIHFIRYHQHNIPHENGTTIKSIPVNQEMVTLYWSYPFHLVFIELHHHQYYLAIMQKTLISSVNETVRKRLSSSDRCPHIGELFNHTLLTYHPLRRIKYYHLLCQRRSSSSSSLSCFYDDDHLCVCDEFENGERHANCFEFNHEMKLDCMGQNGCENGARCFQDHSTCPQTSMCVCPKCFYGRRCQFSMSGFSLSLDGILGYHIRPHVSLRYQPVLIRVSLMVTVIIGAIGLLNSVFSAITFKNKKVLEIGCGYYLLGSSYASLLTMIFFMLKFFILLSSQMGSIKNRSFLSAQCLVTDYLLRSCLNMNQWLNGCVAFDRILVVIKGAHFDRKRSRRNAKLGIICLSIVVMVSTIYDPIHRRLIDDSTNEEDRIWCVAAYPSWLRSFDSVMTMIHFGVPFLINVISALVVSWKMARQRSNFIMSRPFREILNAQLTENMYLLITPVLVIILSSPRLILAIVSGCMGNGRQAWIYLVAYIATVLPSTAAFILLVLPSSMYKNQFRQTFQRYQKSLRNHVGVNVHCQIS